MVIGRRRAVCERPFIQIFTFTSSAEIYTLYLASDGTCKTSFRLCSDGTAAN